MPCKKLVTTSAVILLVLSVGAAAQTAPAVQPTTPTAATSGPPAQAALSDTVTLPAWPKSGVPLTVNSQAVPASFAWAPSRASIPALRRHAKGSRASPGETQTVGKC